MKPLFLERIDTGSFGIDQSHVFDLNDRTIVIRKWNWDYTQAHAFQRHCLNLLQEHPRMRILICCNHPRVLTNGRGLQKPRKGEKLDLVEFDASKYPTLPYPLHQIERGGGLTFHHPGQFIFYPILKLDPKVLSLSSLIKNIFDFTADVLKEWGLEGLSHENKLLGLWAGERKVASMGIAIERLTTFHGMALNILKDEEMSKALALLNPCGLDATTYTSVQDLIQLPERPLENFTDNFLTRITHGWQ